MDDLRWQHKANVYFIFRREAVSALLYLLSKTKRITRGIQISGDTRGGFDLHPGEEHVI